jgi:hypothetical protein
MSSTKLRRPVQVMRRDRGAASRAELAQSDVVRRALAASLPLGSSDFPWVVRSQRRVESRLPVCSGHVLSNHFGSLDHD